MWTPEWIVEPSPMVTPSPMVAKGWMSTFAADLGGGADDRQRADADPRRLRAAGRNGARWRRTPHERRPPGWPEVRWARNRPARRRPPPGTGPAGGSLDLIDQGDLARFGIAQGGGAEDQQLAVADDLPADQRGKFGKGRLHVADSFPGQALSMHPRTKGSNRVQWNVLKSRHRGKSISRVPGGYIGTRGGALPPCQYAGSPRKWGCFAWTEDAAKLQQSAGESDGQIVPQKRGTIGKCNRRTTCATIGRFVLPLA